MEDMKIQQFIFKKLMILFSILFFALAVINSISHEFANGGSGRIEINIRNTGADGAGLIKSGGIEELKGIPLEAVSFMNEETGFVEANNRVYDVKTVLAGEKLKDFYGIRMYKGTFFNSAQQTYGSRVAIISGTLAQKLFSTYGVLGNEISISGELYKISGVYINDRSIYSLLYSDGAERVFVPFESAAESKNKPVKTIFIKDSKLREKAFKVHEIENILKKQKITAGNYKITDFYDNGIYLSQPLSIFIFLVGIAVIFLLLKYLRNFLKLAIKRFRTKLQKGYLLETIFNSKLKIFLSLILFLLFFGTIYGVLLLIRFKCIIPYQYIPKHNIFDVEFYSDVIRTAIYRSNEYTGYIPTKLEILYKNSMSLNLLMLLVLLVTFILIRQEMKIYLRVSKSLFQRSVLLPAALLAGNIPALIICAVSGLAFVFPAKGIIILCAFFIFCLFGSNSSGQYHFSYKQKFFHTSSMDYIK